MLKKFLAPLFIFIVILAFPLFVFAQDYREEFFKGLVLEVTDEGVENINGVAVPFQVVRVLLDSGQEILIDHGRVFSISNSQKVKEGEKIVVSRVLVGAEGQQAYVIRDKYRLISLVYIAAFFFALIFLVAGLKGFGSIVGLFVSLAVIMRFIVPQILAGKDPVIISVLGSLVIMGFTIYLAHGFTKQTHVAVFSTFIALVFTGIISLVFVYLARISGMGSEDAYTLQIGGTNIINLRGLFLGGVIIGALGVLDDVTTTQAATIFELKKANEKLGLSELMRKGLVVGREHVAAVVNTLVLAYAGASLALFIIFAYNPLNMPTWVILNNEFLAEEIVRTLAGTSGLILAVPLTTFLAAWFVTRK
jgi:uncharacterized membrane protein